MARERKLGDAAKRKKLLYRESGESYYCELHLG
jgi:hypothetical protein